jgi:CxxC-x17-CxxC domain-containing protein
MPDIEIPCIQCKEIFLFTEKEQETFYRQNLTTPQRCPHCRSKRRLKDADETTRYEIVCDNCGRHDKVPFQPKVGRSVLCRDCYQANKSRHRIATR